MPRRTTPPARLKFALHGKKLNGHWMLVRMHGHDDEKQQPWLLIKERDEMARPASEFDVTEANCPTAC